MKRAACKQLILSIWFGLILTHKVPVWFCFGFIEQWFSKDTSNLPQELLIQFYSAIIESVLCTSITVWFSSATKSDLRRLRRVVRTAERIIGTTLPTLQRTVLIQSEQKGWQNHSGPSHPAHSLFELLLSGRRYRALSTRTTRHRNSFFPQAIHLMNTWH